MNYLKINFNSRIFISDWFQFINMKSVLLFTFAIEIVVASLFYFDKLFGLGFVLSIISLFMIYFLLLKGPYTWIIIMIVASGLDSWGRIGAGITVFHIAFGFLIFTSVTYYLQNPLHEFILWTPINKYIYLFFGITTFSLIYSPNFEVAITSLATSIALFFAFIVIVNFLKEENQFKKIILSFSILNIPISILAIYQLLFQNVLYFGTSTVATESGEKVWRASATFEDPNVAATFLLVGAILSFALLLFGKLRMRENTLLLISIILSLIGIFATFSRSGLLSAAIGLVIAMLFLNNKKAIFMSIFVGILIVIGFIYLTPYGEFLTSRSLSIFNIVDDPSIRVRISMAISGIWMFIDNPFLGIGFRGFPIYYDIYIHPDAPQILLYVKESHTLWTTLLAELGLLGVGIVSFWFWRVASSLKQQLNTHQSSIMKSVTIGSIALFIALNVNFLFYGNMFPHFNLLWILFGIIYAIDRRMAYPV